MNNTHISKGEIRVTDLSRKDLCLLALTTAMQGNTRRAIVLLELASQTHPPTNTNLVADEENEK